MNKGKSREVLLSWFRLFLKDTYPDYQIEVAELPANKRVRVKMTLGNSSWFFEPVLAQIVVIDDNPGFKKEFLEEVGQLLIKQAPIISGGEMGDIE